MTQLSQLRRAASVRELCTLGDVTPELAGQIRQAWKTIGSRHDARERVNALFGTHGIEYLGQHKRSGNDVYYCNAGDTYALTILFNGPRLFVSTWGDLMEKNAVREPRGAF